MKFNRLIIFLFSFIFLISSTTLLASELILENFEKGKITEKPKWWTFDAIQLTVVPNAKEGPVSLEKYWLRITGTATDWYVGGFGAEVLVDASKYDAIQLDIYGTGARSGRLKIELYDDDNNNQEIEQDENNNYAPLFDDRFVYEKKVNWQGWKTVTIPFTEFKDDNPGVGDGIWNPDQKNGSGGLVNIQFILIATSKTGSVDLGIDNIKLINLPVNSK